jgi:competence protein ComEA
MICLFPLAFTTIEKRAQGGKVIYKKAPAYIYELRGNIMSPGFYAFSDAQSIKALLEVSGGIGDKGYSPPFYDYGDASKVPSGSRIDFLAQGRISKIGAAACLNFFMPISVNHSTVDDLMLIPGIGLKTAAAIVHYRETHGEIRNLEELLAIKGIGRKKFQSFIPFLKVAHHPGGS